MNGKLVGGGRGGGKSTGKGKTGKYGGRVPQNLPEVQQGDMRCVLHERSGMYFAATCVDKRCVNPKEAELSSKKARSDNTGARTGEQKAKGGKGAEEASYKKTRTEAHFHYNGWHAKYDEWLPVCSKRIRACDHQPDLGKNGRIHPGPQPSSGSEGEEEEEGRCAQIVSCADRISAAADAMAKVFGMNWDALSTEVRIQLYRAVEEAGQCGSQEKKGVKDGKDIEREEGYNDEEDEEGEGKYKVCVREVLAVAAEMASAQGQAWASMTFKSKLQLFCDVVSVFTSPNRPAKLGKGSRRGRHRPSTAAAAVGAGDGGSDEEEIWHDTAGEAEMPSPRSSGVWNMAQSGADDSLRF